MVDKNELCEALIKKGATTKEEFNKLYDEALKEMKEKGVPEDKLETYAYGRVQAMFKRQLMSQAESFEGFVIGISGIMDFGRKQREAAIKVWQMDKEKAVAEKFCDEEGHPLWKSGINEGKPITPDNVGRTVFMMVKKEGDENPKYATLGLSGKNVHMEVPIFQLVKFRANVNKKTTDEMYVLNKASVTEFNVVDGKIVDLPSVALKFLGDKCSSLGNIREWHSANVEDPNRLVIAKGNVVDIVMTGEGISNIVTIDSPELSFLGDNEEVAKPITCWIPEDLSIGTTIGAMDILVIGKTGITKDDAIQINSYGIWVPEIWRSNEKPKEVNEENGKTIEESPTKVEEKKEEVKEEVKEEKKESSSPDGGW